MIRHLKRKIASLHRDTRGAISILVLLTIWCFVAIAGMVWNTSEESTRREVLQTAADSAAHASAVWMARTGNAITAQNMIICQDVSTQAVWAAVPPTDDRIYLRLFGDRPGVTPHRSGELDAAKDQGLITAARLRAVNLEALFVQIAADNVALSNAIEAINTENTNSNNFTDLAEQADYQNKLRQIDSARNWIVDSYVNGLVSPQLEVDAPARPRNPGPHHEGLARAMGDLVPLGTPGHPSDIIIREILDYVANFIDTQERPYLDGFEARTAYAVSQPVDSQMARHEAEVWANEQAMLAALPEAIEAQRQQIADFYKVDLTLANLQNSPANGGPAIVNAPYMPASMVESWPNYQDIIRTSYPVETLGAHLPLIFDIDGISPHVDSARIWHPPLIVTVEPATRALVPGLRETITVGAEFPNGWGHAYAMPLERYTLQRASYDLLEIKQKYMDPLDYARSVTLAHHIHKLMVLPDDFENTIYELPLSIPDDRKKPAPPGKPPLNPPVYEEINLLPLFTAPSRASSRFQRAVDAYNTSRIRLVSDVRALYAQVIAYVYQFSKFTQPFASETWESAVMGNAESLLNQLGQSKQFMVPSTYALRKIPDWAKPGMYASAETAIENQIFDIAMLSVGRAITGDLALRNPDHLNPGVTDLQYIPTALTAGYAAKGVGIADSLVRPAARRIASEVALEWVNRPWAYEITPPPDSRTRGLLPDERKLGFTVMAAARQTDATGSRLVLPSIFGAEGNKLVAYAQGEMFNWKEFNPVYGAQPIDRVTYMPEVTYLNSTARFNNFVGSPRGWRVASLGGWEWRSRLSLSDSLFEQIQVNSELTHYLNDAGMHNPTSGALDEINLH